MQGRVLKSTGSWYTVQTSDEDEFSCRLRGKFKLGNKKMTNPLAVGDQVVFELDENSQGVITNILPRQNYVIRKSPHKSEHSHIIASNIDQAIIIATLVYPKTSFGFIDRILVALESFRIPAIIIFNKVDLLEDEGIALLDEICSDYERIGYNTLKTSMIDDVNLKGIKQILNGKTSLVSGHSGVGKSTMINKLSSTINQKTSHVSDFAQKGVHTTTFAEMFKVAAGSYIIDTPGVKEFGLFDIQDEELGHYFPEFRQLLSTCKFHNCRHVHEPGCAIIDKVEEEVIPLSRYESYLSMLENHDNRR